LAGKPWGEKGKKHQKAALFLNKAALSQQE
jgi:hypothetical protein